MTVYQNEDGTKVEYRVWNPFRSKLAAAILGGVDNIWIVSHESGLFILLLLIYRYALYGGFVFVLLNIETWC